MELGLGPVDFVLDGDPAPLPKRGEPPNFQSMFIVAKRLDGQDGTWHGDRPQPRGLCVRWGPSPLNFRPVFIIVIVILLEHCTVVIGLFKFKF